MAGQRMRDLLTTPGAHEFESHLNSSPQFIKESIMTGDDEDAYIPAAETQTHPASGGGLYEIPNLSGETAEHAESIDGSYAQYETGQRNH